MTTTTTRPAAALSIGEANQTPGNPAFQQLLDAALTYQAAKTAVRGHTGRLDTAEYAEKLSLWRRALLDLDKAIDAAVKTSVEIDVDAPAA